jgi:hypothetical protein
MTTTTSTPGRHAPARQHRRADAGRIRLTQRDIDGLILCAEHGGAPYDLLAAAMTVTPDRLRAIVARWRRAGYAATGRLGPGPAWCWLTPAGMAATGFRYPATRPALARLAHLRAVLAARLDMAASRDWQTFTPWWHSERRIRAHSAAGAPHRPDGEVHWPSVAESPHAGLVWAIEVELTPKPITRATAIMAALTAPDTGYSMVLYYAAPPARPVLARARQRLDPGPGRVFIRDLPPAAYLPDPQS